MHGCGPPGSIDEHLEEMKKILLSREPSDTTGDTYQHLKRTRTFLRDGSRLIQPYQAHVLKVADQLGIMQSKPTLMLPIRRIIRGVITKKAIT